MRWPRRSRLVSDERDVFDMTRMRHWGYNAHWFPREAVGEQAVLYCPWRPQEGDVLEDATDSYVVVEVDTPSDPGDQHFVKVLPLNEPRGTYERTRQRSDYIP